MPQWRVVSERTIYATTRHVGVGAMSNTPKPYFANDRHALYCGWVVGLAMRHGLLVSLVDDEEGNHTDHMRVFLGDAFGERFIVDLVVPEPPVDWTFE